MSAHPRTLDIDDLVRFDALVAGELYAGVENSTYEQKPDARVYQWSLQEGKTRSLDATLATAIHDRAIGGALEDVLRHGELAGRRTVGVMGGHAAARGSRNYDDAARLGRLLAFEGRLVATDGGPCAMEAANLGVYLSGRDSTVPRLGSTTGRTVVKELYRT